MFTSLLGYCTCNFGLPSCRLMLSGMECLLQQFDDCRTMGEDKTTWPNFLMEAGLQSFWWQVVWALVAGHHFLIQVTSKQILPVGCPPSQSRRQVSTLTQSAQSVCHSLKIESSLQSVQFPAPSAWWWRWGGGHREEEMGRRAGLGAKPHSRGQGSSQPPHWAGVLCLVLAATLEVLLLHNSHELWNVFGHLQHDCVTP